MAKLIVALFICIVAPVEADYCRSTKYPAGGYCTYGCCNTYDNPCCNALSTIKPVTQGSVSSYNKVVIYSPIGAGCVFAAVIVMSVLKLCSGQTKAVPAKGSVPAKGAVPAKATATSAVQIV